VIVPRNALDTAFAHRVDDHAFTALQCGESVVHKGELSLAAGRGAEESNMRSTLVGPVGAAATAAAADIGALVDAVRDGGLRCLSHDELSGLLRDVTA
jgi:hypothetical protein